MVALALSGCAQVEVKDIEMCLDLSPTGAHCAHTLTTETREIPESLWSSPPLPGPPVGPPTSRIGRFSLSAQSIADIKTMIEQLCSKTDCTYQKPAIKRFFLWVKSQRAFLPDAPRSLFDPIAIKAQDEVR